MFLCFLRKIQHARVNSNFTKCRLYIIPQLVNHLEPQHQAMMARSMQKFQIDLKTQIGNGIMNK